MSLEDYLKQNIKPEILQKASEFKNSILFGTRVLLKSKRIWNG